MRRVMRRIRKGGSLLLGAHEFPFDRLVVVGSSTSGTKAVQVILNVVEAELADLYSAS